MTAPLSEHILVTILAQLQSSCSTTLAFCTPMHAVGRGQKGSRPAVIVSCGSWAAFEAARPIFHYRWVCPLRPAVIWPVVGR